MNFPRGIDGKCKACRQAWTWFHGLGDTLEGRCRCGWITTLHSLPVGDEPDERQWFLLLRARRKGAGFAIPLPPDWWPTA